MENKGHYFAMKIGPKLGGSLAFGLGQLCILCPPLGRGLGLARSLLSPHQRAEAGPLVMCRS